MRVQNPIWNSWEACQMWRASCLCSYCSVRWKRILMEITFFISKVFLGSEKQYPLQNVSTVGLIVFFHTFANKSKWCFASWKNPTANHNRVDFLLSFYNDWWTKNLFWSNLVFESVVDQIVCANFEKYFVVIMSGPLHWCYPFLKPCVFVGHRKILECFHFFRTAIQETHSQVVKLLSGWGSSFLRHCSLKFS